MRKNDTTIVVAKGSWKIEVRFWGGMGWVLVQEGCSKKNRQAEVKPECNKGPGFGEDHVPQREHPADSGESLCWHAHRARGILCEPSGRRAGGARGDRAIRSAHHRVSIVV